MDINSLLILKKVVEFGGFSAAAQQLGLPKSSVSQRVAQLERELGTRLLHRTTRRVSMTEVGARVYEAAIRVAEETEDIASFVRDMHGEPQGQLRVTAPHDLGMVVISHVLPGFRAKYPQIEIDLDVSNRYVDLITEGYDLALRASDRGLKDSSLVGKPLLTSSFKLYASPNLFAKRAPPRKGEELTDFPVVWFGQPGRRGTSTWTLKSRSREQEVQLHPVVRCNDMLAIKQAVVTGMGIGSLPEIVCRAELAGGELTPVLPEWTIGAATFYTVHPSRKYMPAKTRAFVEYLRETLRC